MAGGRAQKRSRRNGRKKQEKEDRISHLSDDVLHIIFSFLNLDLAVRASILSSRWKTVWTSVSHLNFNSDGFPTKAKFSLFVNSFLSRRNQAMPISTITFNSTWAIEPPLFRRILRYGFSHGVQFLDITNDCSTKLKNKPKTVQYPITVFSSPSLTHLCLDASKAHIDICPSCPETQSIVNPTPRSPVTSPWKLPLLTTLILANIRFKFSFDDGQGYSYADPFSRLVSLKDLTLDYCDTYYLDKLNIVSATLEKLSIFTSYYKNDPQTCWFVISTPNLKSFSYSGGFPLYFSSTEQPPSRLREASISLWTMGWLPHSEVPFDLLHAMFRWLCNAAFLTVSTGTAHLLTATRTLLGNRPSPFYNLKALTFEIPPNAINIFFDRARVGAYFLKSSPKASIPY